MKIFIFIFSTLLVNISFSGETETNDYLISQGLPLPDGGINILPSSSIQISNELKQKYINQKKEEDEKGFHTEETLRPHELLTLLDDSYAIFAQNRNDNNRNSSKLRKTINEINLAYNFKPTPLSDDIQITGFAASGGFNNGWNGVVQFFNKQALGSCAYTENNIKLSHGSININQNDVRYDVNGKASILEVKGTKDSGFLYTINWFDPHFFRTLECANIKFSHKHTKSLIELAKRIDEK